MTTQTFTGYRFFTITEESLDGDGDRWRITVSDQGNVVDQFDRATRREALRALRAAGYVKVGRDNR